MVLMYSEENDAFVCFTPAIWRVRLAIVDGVFWHE